MNRSRARWRRAGTVVLAGIAILWGAIGARVYLEAHAVEPGAGGFRDFWRSFASLVGGGIVLVAVMELLLANFAWRGSRFASLLVVLSSLLLGMGAASFALRPSGEIGGGNAVLAGSGLAHVAVIVAMLRGWPSDLE